MKVAKKLFLVNSLIAEVRASIPPDPYAGLTDRQRATVKEYERNTSPVQQYVAVMNGTNPTTVLLESVGLSANCTETEAREAYERELASFDNWFKRRNFKGIRSDA